MASDIYRQLFTGSSTSVLSVKEIALIAGVGSASILLLCISSILIIMLFIIAR